jgi:hypothetical protein
VIIGYKLLFFVVAINKKQVIKPITTCEHKNKHLNRINKLYNKKRKKVSQIPVFSRQFKTGQIEKISREMKQKIDF